MTIAPKLIENSKFSDNIEGVFIHSYGMVVLTFSTALYVTLLIPIEVQVECSFDHIEMTTMNFIITLYITIILTLLEEGVHRFK